MTFLTKTATVCVVLVAVVLVAQWVDAAGVAGRSYEYRTIPTPDVQGTYVGFGEFEEDAVFLVTIEEDTTPEDAGNPSCASEVYDGSWRQRRFRRRTFFRSQFDAFGNDYDVAGRMPTSGLLVGTAHFEEDGDRKLVRWKAEETNACDLTAP